jgi:hypothetical protein
MAHSMCVTAGRFLPALTPLEPCACSHSRNKCSTGHRGALGKVQQVNVPILGRARGALAPTYGNASQGHAPGGFMLAKCVNPSCSISFRHLREGRLLRVEKNTPTEHGPAERRKPPASARSTEYYWLCGQCSPTFNLAFDRGSGIVLIPLATTVASSPPSPTRDRRGTASVA